MITKIKEIDKTVMKIFKDIQVMNDKGDASDVPIVWASREKVLSLFSCKVTLPLLSINQKDFNFEPMPVTLGSIYEVTVHSMYQEDMNQIVEQIVSKFDNTKNCILENVSIKDCLSTKELKICRCVATVKVEDISKPIETHA